MTEMVYGAVPAQRGEPILPKWWRTLDKWSMTSVLVLSGIGLLLGLAASPPLAARNGFDPFHYVERQAVFGMLALAAMLLTSMMSPTLVRRLAVLGFLGAFVALALLPVFGTDFGKGAVRWYSLGFASVQPSEFMKPVFIVVAAWMLAASQQINGPPGKLWSFILCVTIVGMLVMQPDFGQACLVLFGWGVMYFVAGAPMLLLVFMAAVVVLGGVGAGLVIGFLWEWIREHKHRREAAEKAREARKLNREVSKLKKQKNEGKDEVLALLEDAG